MTTPSHYHRFSIALHWLMFLLIITAYALIESRVLFAKGSEARDLVKSLHFMLGLTVFFLVWLRLLLRLLHPAPPITPTPPLWQQRAAGLVHLLLYGFMIGMPILGWLILSGEGKAVPFYGLELPRLMADDHELAEQFEHWHEEIGEIFYFVIGAHALAALAHHYWQKDDTLRRMWRRS
jgi:cytochrome b561